MKETETSESEACRKPLRAGASRLAREQRYTMQGIYILSIWVISKLYIAPPDDCPELLNSLLLYQDEGQWAHGMKFYNATIQIKKASDAKLLIVVLAVHIDGQSGNVSPGSVNPVIKIQPSNTIKYLFWYHLKKEKSQCITWPSLYVEYVFKELASCQGINNVDPAEWAQ